MNVDCVELISGIKRMAAMIKEKIQKRYGHTNLKETDKDKDNMEGNNRAL